MEKILKIKVDIPEQKFMEYLLNMKHSGYDVLMFLCFYAFINSWNINKLNYYLKLLKEKGVYQN